MNMKNTQELKSIPTVNLRKLINPNNPQPLFLRYEGFMSLSHNEWLDLGFEGQRNEPRSKIVFKDCQTEAYVHLDALDYWQWRNCYKNQEWSPPHFTGKKHGETPYTRLTNTLDLVDSYGFYYQLLERKIEPGQYLAISFAKVGQFPGGEPTLSMRISVVIGGEFLPG